MKASWKIFILAAIYIFIGRDNAWAQDDRDRDRDRDPPVLHIRHTATTSKIGFPQSLFMYHLLDGPNSNGEVRTLTGTVILENHSSEFSEVLWVLAYWKGECPINDQNLTKANVIWTEIQKNPTESKNVIPVEFHFPHPLPMTACV